MKRWIKFSGLVLALIIALTCVAVAAPASAATGDVVYFDNSVTNFGTVNCYMWKDGLGDNGGWPGQAMTKVDGDIWAYNITGDYDKVIFNDGSTQSDDLSYPGNGQVAKPLSNGGKFQVSWSAYSGNETLPQQPTQATQPATSGGSTGSANSIYCLDEAGWGNVYCYMWNSANDQNSGWPGVSMTNLGENVFEYTPSKKFANVIFNSGGDNNKTGDMTAPSGVKIYNNASGEWSDYSVGPLKIKSFKASVDSPVYTGANVKLTAEATSTAGAVSSYKFSVKGSTGTSVLSQSAAKTATWVPTVVGNYTITLDVTDSAGNTESRSIAMEVKDATTLQEAFISAFSNSLNTNTQIKQNTNISFTMKALGGHTGNGLLFYKFVITDPSGGSNVAYYTTKNVYSYTPSKLGTYTIEAFVQNSYNATVSKTYTYNCVSQITETAEDTNPQPATQPATAAPQPATQPVTTAPQPATVAPQPTTAAPATTAPVPATTTSTPKPGDVNHDGSVNVLDATLIQKHIVGNPVKYFDISLADVDGSGKIRIQDATEIQKYAAGLPSKLQ